MSEQIPNNSSNHNGSQKTDGRIVHLLEVLQNDLSYKWSIGEMAREVNLSISHLNRLFKIEFDLTPLQYLRESRLEKAADLLKNSFLSIKEIRGATGWRDKKQFINDFKKKFGMNPSDYRKNHGRNASAVNGKASLEKTEMRK